MAHASASAKVSGEPGGSKKQARVGARDKVKQARRALLERERRHDRAAAKVEALSRRKKALDLELGDAEAEPGPHQVSPRRHQAGAGCCRGPQHRPGARELTDPFEQRAGVAFDVAVAALGRDG